MIDDKFVKDALEKNVSDIKVEYFSEISSTSTYLASQNLLNQNHLCFASVQTAGKGRRGGKWVSSCDDNIYATLAIRCDFTLEKLPLLNLTIAMIIADSIRNVINILEQQNIKIKLPNDIYFNDKKLAGILIETKNISRSGFDLLIGFGINVNMHNLSEAIDREWDSLELINDKTINSAELLVNVVQNLIYGISSFYSKNKTDLIAKFSQYDYVLDKCVTFHDGLHAYIGIAKGITEKMQLLLELDRGVLAIDISKINKLRVV